MADALKLAQVRFIPGGTPPHRETPRTSAAHRVAMTRLAITNNPRFALDDRETRREGLSYTFDTLTEVRAEVGAATPLVLMMGADAFVKFDTWHQWQAIFELANIAVAHRPGASLGAMPPAIAEEVTKRRATAITGAAGAVFEVPITALDISATAIRALVAHGLSTRYLLTPEVQTHITSNHLFLKDN